jgi:hypothetical protein
VFAVKTQQVSTTATRWDSTFPPAFVAHQLVERRKIMKATEERPRVIDSIQTSGISATIFSLDWPRRM